MEIVVVIRIILYQSVKEVHRSARIPKSVSEVTYIITGKKKNRNVDTFVP